MSEHRLPVHPWNKQLDGPLYMMSMPPRFTDAELASALEDTYQIAMSHQSPYAWVADLTSILAASPQQRRLWAENDRRMEAHDRQFCAGSGIIVTTRFARGLITAVTWLNKPAYPMRVFATFDEANRWARAQLIARGVDIEPG